MSILKQLGFTMLLCASGAASIAPSMANAQSNWSFEYTYEGTSTINYVNGGSQTVNIAPEPFSTPRTLGAGYTWTKLSSFNSEIAVTATWTGSGSPPSEQVFKIESVTSIYGSSGYSGGVDNGLGHAGVQLNANTLNASGQRWFVGQAK